MGPFSKCSALVIICFTVIFFLPSQAFSQQDEISRSPTEDRFDNLLLFISGWSEAIKKYQVSLIRAMLEADKEAFGNTKFRFIERSFNTRRSMLGFSSADPSISFTSGWNKRFVDAIFTSNHAYMNHLLGIRRCITTPSKLPIFKKIYTLDDFRSIRVGQGVGWPDVNVYEKQGVKVVISPELKFLPGMLEKGRFDCLALSAIEVDNFLHGGSAVIDDGLFVVYPLTMKLISSSEYLVKRFDAAFLRLRKLGKIEELLKNHFGSKAFPSLKHSRVIYLDNPELSSTKNVREIKSIKKLYGV